MMIRHCDHGGLSWWPQSDRVPSASAHATIRAMRFTGPALAGSLFRLLCGLVVFVTGSSCAYSESVWRAVWSDEFSGPANTAPDSSKWSYDLGAGGWGNKELETYTDSTDNAYLDGNGNLVIRVQRTSSLAYTSARLKTLGKFSFTYGKVEARIKIPYGQGIWPAFWMLGADLSSVGWPACGEIDIMENIGREPYRVHGTLHGPGYSGGGAVTAAYSLPDGPSFADDFHTFSVVWTPKSVEFFVDSQSYLKATPSSLPKSKQWVFNKPFFLLLNVAVGGNWPGPPAASTEFPQMMIIDYVRVYQEAEIGAGAQVKAVRRYGEE